MGEIVITIVFTIVGILGGGLVSWCITAYYTKISSQELEKFANQLIQKMGEKDVLIESLADNNQDSQKALDANSEIRKSIIREANAINQKYRAHIDTSSLIDKYRCPTCGSNLHWNGNRCMHCGQIDDDF